MSQLICQSVQRGGGHSGGWSGCRCRGGGSSMSRGRCIASATRGRSRGGGGRRAGAVSGGGGGAHGRRLRAVVAAAEGTVVRRRQARLRSPSPQRSRKWEHASIEWANACLTEISTIPEVSAKSIRPTIDRVHASKQACRSVTVVHSHRASCCLSSAHVIPPSPHLAAPLRNSAPAARRLQPSRTNKAWLRSCIRMRPRSLPPPLHPHPPSLPPLPLSPTGLDAQRTVSARHSIWTHRIAAWPACLERWPPCRVRASRSSRALS